MGKTEIVNCVGLSSYAPVSSLTSTRLGTPGEPGGVGEAPPGGDPQWLPSESAANGSNDFRFVNCVGLTPYIPQGQPAKLNIQDRELLRRFEIIDRLPEQGKALAKEILDLLILKHRFQELVGSGPVR